MTLSSDVVRSLRCRFWVLTLAAAVAGCLGSAEVEHTRSAPPGSSDDPSGSPGSPGSGDEVTYPDRPATEGGGDGGTATTACTAVPSPGTTPMHKLTNQEYDNTVSALLGLPGHHSADLPADLTGLGFTTSAESYSISLRHAEKYLEAAERIAAATDLSKVLPCTATTDACAQKFIDSFGSKAFRRPITAEERTRLMAVYTAGKGQSDFETGIRMVIEAVLQSADFLYRPEFGAPVAGAKVVPITDYEMASRLSYFLWSSMPDETLFAAAANGELRTPDQIEAQARRMVADPRARKTVATFNEQWLELEVLDHAEKDESHFPDWQTIRPLLRKETALFMDDVFWNPASNVASMFTSKTSFMNKPLADFYGLTGPQGSEFVKVTLDGKQRQGLLTQASMMAVHASTKESNPVLRGRFVRQQLLCHFLPPPPADVAIIPPEPDPNLTTRERFDAHRTDPACAGCHSLMDPIGFGFENYDAVGAYRTEENGKTIDATGTLTATSVDGNFNGPVDLSNRLAESKEIRECATLMWFRFLVGRAESTEDDCTLQHAEKLFAESGDKFPELLVALTQTDAFLYRKAVVPGGQ